MKVIKKKIVTMVVLMFISVILFVVSLNMEHGDFINGFSAGLFGVALAKTIQFLLMTRNEKMMKKFQIEHKEERLIMIAEKSGRFTLFITILVEIAVGIVFMFLDKQMVTVACCCVAAAQTVVYAFINYILSKRY